MMTLHMRDPVNCTENVSIGLEPVRLAQDDHMVDWPPRAWLVQRDLGRLQNKIEPA
jgi:hypothetical protein